MHACCTVCPKYWCVVQHHQLCKHNTRNNILGKSIERTRVYLAKFMLNDWYGANCARYACAFSKLFPKILLHALCCSSTLVFLHICSTVVHISNFAQTAQDVCLLFLSSFLKYYCKQQYYGKDKKSMHTTCKSTDVLRHSSATCTKTQMLYCCGTTCATIF